MEILKKRKTMILILVLVIAIVLVITFSILNKKEDSKSNLTKITFCLDWTPNTNHTGLFVAKAKGYFEELGLDVEFVQPPEDTATTLVGAKKADFGIDFQDSLAPAFEADVPVTVVATIAQHNTSGIISLKENNILSPKGMENKTYATWDLPVEKAMIEHCVKLDGGDPTKVNMLPTYVTDVVTGLGTDIDCVWIYYGWEGIAAKVNNLDTNFFFFKDIDPAFDYYTPVIVANNEFLENNPEITKKFLEGCKKGYEFSIDNPEEAANILLAEDSTLDKSFVLESQKWMSKEYKAENSNWGYIDSARWNNFYKWLYDNKLTEKELTGGFTNQYLD